MNEKAQAYPSISNGDDKSQIKITKAAIAMCSRGNISYMSLK